MSTVFWSEAGVVEDQPRSGALRLQLESSDGVKPLRPLCEPPRLDDPLIRNQLNVSSYHAATETIECPTGFGVDLGRARSERAELLGIQKRFVNALRTRLVFNLLMNRHRLCSNQTAQREGRSCNTHDNAFRGHAGIETRRQKMIKIIFF
jgi:hypothetical protein